MKNNYFTDNFDDENEQALLDKYKNETRNLTEVIQEIKKEVSLKEEEKIQAKPPLPSDLAKFSSLSSGSSKIHIENQQEEE